MMMKMMRMLISLMMMMRFFDDEDDEEDEEMDGGMPRPKKGFSSKPEKHEKPSTFLESSQRT